MKTTAGNLLDERAVLRFDVGQLVGSTVQRVAARRRMSCVGRRRTEHRMRRLASNRPSASLRLDGSLRRP